MNGARVASCNAHGICLAGRAEGGRRARQEAGGLSPEAAAEGRGGPRAEATAGGRGGAPERRGPVTRGRGAAGSRAGWSPCQDPDPVCRDPWSCSVLTLPGCHLPEFPPNPENWLRFVDWTIPSTGCHVTKKGLFGRKSVSAVHADVAGHAHAWACAPGRRGVCGREEEVEGGPPAPQIFVTNVAFPAGSPSHGHAERQHFVSRGSGCLGSQSPLSRLSRCHAAWGVRPLAGLRHGEVGAPV